MQREKIVNVKRKDSQCKEKRKGNAKRKDSQCKEKR